MQVTRKDMIVLAAAQVAGGMAGAKYGSNAVLNKDVMKDIVDRSLQIANEIYRRAEAIPTEIL